MINEERSKQLIAEAEKLPFTSQLQALKKIFSGLQTQEALDFILFLCSGSLNRETNCEIFLAAFLRDENLETLFHYDQLSLLYEAAGERQDSYLQALLLRRNIMPKYLPLPEDEPPRISTELESWTLGERLSFAKSTDQKKLQALLFDNHPMVIANLLANPRIYEVEVLKIASKRPQSHGVLISAFAHPRWCHHYSVRKAIAFNPALLCH
jgi:hypothetical protein